MNLTNVSPLLRWSLRIDALASAVTGLALAVLATELAPLLGLPQALLWWAGVGVLCYGIAVGALSTRAQPPRWAVLAVIVGNALYTLDCLLLAFGGWLAPTALGVAFLLVQAAAVGALAEAQYIGLRRSTPARGDAGDSAGAYSSAA